MCGKIKAYQFGVPDAFYAYFLDNTLTIDDAYVSGLSVTHSNPRQHIWTFANGLAEIYAFVEVCPCDTNLSLPVPTFVGEDYFCESGVNEQYDGNSHYGVFHLNDALWDGQDCISSSTCCTRNSPPYFTRQLPQATSDDIEARICLFHDGDVLTLQFLQCIYTWQWISYPYSWVRSRSPIMLSIH